MNKEKQKEEEKQGRLFVWQGYTGKVELISFKTFLTKHVRRVALGGEHSLFLTYDDFLYSCGSNEHGALGVPSFTGDYSFDPCLVESLTGKGITDIACGLSHCGAICGNRQLYSWGNSESGQCGVGIEDKKITSPTLVKLTTPVSVCQSGVETPEKHYQARQVSCGASHSVAVSTDGNVWVWGSGIQLGLKDTRKCLVPTILSAFVNKDVLKVHCGDYHSVVLVAHADHDTELNIAKDRKPSSKTIGAVDSPKRSVDSPKSSKIRDSNRELTTCDECNKQVGLEHDEDHVFEGDNVRSNDLSREGSSKKSKARISANMVEDYYGENAVNRTDTNINDVENRTSDILEDTSEKAGQVLNDKGKIHNEGTQAKSVLSGIDTKTGEIEIEGNKVENIANETKDSNVVDNEVTVLKEKEGETTEKKVDESSAKNVLLEHAEHTNEIKDSSNIGADEQTEIHMRPKAPVELKIESKGSQYVEDPLSQSVKSATSVSSSMSNKSRTKSFLNEETREYLAKQFDEDSGFVKTPVKKSEADSSPKPETPVSPGYSLKQGFDTVTSLTSHMTSHVTSLTSKALGNITSVFSYSDGSGSESGDKIKAREMLSERDSERSESPALDDSTLDLSTMGDITTNVSLMSLTEAETSLQGEATPEGSPWKKKRDSVQGTPEKKQKSTPASPVSVSKQSQSIRTLEAKQEQLRKRSLNLQAADEDKTSNACRITMETEIWTWGLNSKGQLGLGDMIERPEPVPIQYLNGKRIVKVAAGSQHTLALTSTGQKDVICKTLPQGYFGRFSSSDSATLSSNTFEVYSWGLNLSGQLGHTEMSSAPATIPLNKECVIWDISAGSNHSIFLMDHAEMKDNRPDVYYVGKHPCKDLYVPIYKTAKLTQLKYIKKAGWVRSVTTGGDNCSCLSRDDSAMTTIMFEFSHYLRKMYLHQYNVEHEFIKRLQLAGFYTSLDVYPYKGMMGSIMNSFIDLTKKLGDASIEVAELLRTGESLPSGSFFTKYDDHMTSYRKYASAFSDMEAVGGFEYAVKEGSDTFDKLKEFYKELLNLPNKVTKVDHAEKFRQIMYIPLTYLKDLSAIISRFSDVYDRESPESNLLSSAHLNFEHLIRTSSTEVTNAENTRKFWETCNPKIAENVRSTARRLIKESKSSPISLASSGRFSSHLFYLFTDVFIHSQSSSYQIYRLETVWVDTPADSTGHQNSIHITTPEESFTLTTKTPALKVEWMMALNSAINKNLTNQKAVARQTSSERINPPVIRQAAHSFTKHLTYKEAKYDGYWLNGKPHGSGRLKWPDGKKYTGRFKHGMQFGFGKLVFPVGEGKYECHEGNWKDGKLHGHGKIRYGNGDLYDGYFKDGQRQGHGVYRKGKRYNTASFVYVGEWLSDRLHGYGVMDDILKGEKYMGMWQDDNRHGDGIVVTLDGMYFEGNFQHNKLTGFGLMLTDDNSCYEGEFSGITLLQGKGTLTFPSGDKIEGTFSGTWNQGLKITGTFYKDNNTTSLDRKLTNDIKSSLYGKLCVRPDRKWEEMFYQCYESLQYSGEGEPNTQKAWEQIAIIVTSCRNKIKDRTDQSLTSKIKKQICNLEKLEKIPPYGKDHLSIEHFAVIKEYLGLAFDTHYHPLGHLIEGLVDVFRAAYIGIGAHSRLLYHAVQEIKSFIKRIFATLRIIFPELPKNGGPVQVYLESSQKGSSPMSEELGFLQRQISEPDEDEEKEVVSAEGLLQPILLPKIYPALFDLYALHCDKEDEKYWERIQKLNKQGDMSLMAYLGVDSQFWCIDKSLFKEEKHKRLSTLKDHCFSSAVDVLQQISTAFCPQDKLEIIQKTFMTITQTVEEFLEEEHVWCMDDLFPIFQFVVVRAKIHHLGAEIHLIEELMESYLEFGELGIMFTTLKACYYQIQSEKIPIH